MPDEGKRLAECSGCAELRQRVAALADAVAVLEAAQAAPDSRAEMLLRAAWLAVGADPFTTRQLLDLAATPRRIALRAAIEAHGIPIPHPEGDRVPGGFLARLVGVTADGITLAAVGRRGNGTLYRLSASPKHSKHSRQSAAFTAAND